MNAMEVAHTYAVLFVQDGECWSRHCPPSARVVIGGVEMSRRGREWHLSDGSRTWTVAPQAVAA